jgi:hypothetical protein
MVQKSDDSNTDGLIWTISFDLCAFITATFEEKVTMKFIDNEGQFQGHSLGKVQKCT